MDPVDVAGESETSSATDHPPSVRLASVAPDETLLERVVTGVRGVYDPEIPLNIYDLGLIYRIDITEEGKVAIDMTLTSPHCPVAESLPGEVETAVRAVEGITDVQLELVWDPPWDMDRMGEAARLELGLM